MSFGTFPQTVTLIVESTGAAGVLFSLTVRNGFSDSGGGASWGVSFPPIQLLNLQGANIKLDATQTYQLRCAAIDQAVNCYLTSSFVFTTNPN
jgi:hypothetical protein